MEAVDPMRVLLAFLFVLGLIGVMALVLKHWGRGLLTGKSLLGANAVEGRLSIIETRYIDARRRLVLVRRDGREHLILLADGREQLIESYDAPNLTSTQVAS